MMIPDYLESLIWSRNIEEDQLALLVADHDVLRAKIMHC